MLASRPLELAPRTTRLIISNEEMDHMKSREESDLLIKGVNKTIKNESKEWKGGFFRMLLGALGVSFLGNLLTAK